VSYTVFGAHRGDRDESTFFYLLYVRPIFRDHLVTLAVLTLQVSDQRVRWSPAQKLTAVPPKTQKPRKPEEMDAHYVDP
jgi:hypothetical protein